MLHTAREYRLVLENLTLIYFDIFQLRASKSSGGLVSWHWQSGLCHEYGPAQWDGAGVSPQKVVEQRLVL